MGWLEMTKYKDEQVMINKHLVETMLLPIYSWPMVTFDQGSEFIDHEFKNSLI